MSPFNRGVIYGVVTFLLVLLSYVVGYGSGRAEIVDQCGEHRAFVYGTDAWGCVRLRKGVRDPSFKEGNFQPSGVQS